MPITSDDIYIDKYFDYARTHRDSCQYPHIHIQESPENIRKQYQHGNVVNALKHPNCPYDILLNGCYRWEDVLENPILDLLSLENPNQYNTLIEYANAHKYASKMDGFALLKSPQIKISVCSWLSFLFSRMIKKILANRSYMSDSRIFYRELYHRDLDLRFIFDADERMTLIKDAIYMHDGISTLKSIHTRLSSKSANNVDMTEYYTQLADRLGFPDPYIACTIVELGAVMANELASIISNREQPNHPRIHSWVLQYCTDRSVFRIDLIDNPASSAYVKKVHDAMRDNWHSMVNHSEMPEYFIDRSLICERLPSLSQMTEPSFWSSMKP